MRWVESIEDIFLLLHNFISRVLQRLHKSKPVRFIARAQDLMWAGLRGWNIIEDGIVNFEGAGRNSHQQGNVIAKISKLACATGQTLCGKASGRDDAINKA